MFYWFGEFTKKGNVLYQMAHLYLFEFLLIPRDTAIGFYDW